MNGAGSPERSLTPEDKVEVFKIATPGLLHHFCAQFKAGMTDNELWAALEVTLGLFGGSGGPDRLSVSYKGSGLRIWGAWHIVNQVIEPPLFSGRATVAMARTVYNIADPEDNQLALF